MIAQEQRPVWGATGTCDDSPIPPGTTWNAWTPLSRRCLWTSGSVQNVRGQRQLPQQVRLSLGRVPSCCHCPMQPLCPSLLPRLADSGSGSEDLSLLLADVVPTSSRLRPRLGRTRAIARTRQSERVRATVNRNRLSTARSSPVRRWGRAVGVSSFTVTAGQTRGDVLCLAAPPTQRILLLPCSMSHGTSCPCWMRPSTLWPWG